MHDPAKVRKNLGVRIRFLRQQMGWSQWQMEKETGVARTFTSAVERGLRYVSVSTLCKYAAAFNTTLSNLLQGVDDGRSSSKRRAKDSTTKGH